MSAHGLASSRSLPDIRGHSSRPLLVATPEIRRTKERLVDRLAQTNPGELARPWSQQHGKHLEFQRLLLDCDKDNVKQLKRLHKTFPFQAYIQGGENRGLSIEQLARVHKFAAAVCAEWGLSMDAVNLYHMNKWVITPTTKVANSAFAEHLTRKKQPPTWFVSHYWGEPVTIFLKCLEKHMATRGLSAATVFWVCAYAQRPHASQIDACSNPRQTTFYKAMEAARFKLLLILDGETDTTAPATPCTRLWSCYECSICLGNPSCRLDVATCAGNEVTIITEGMTAQEQTFEKWRPGTGLAAKTLREQSLPLRIVETSLRWDSWDVRKARTRAVEDRTYILNSITERDLDAVPEIEHAKYQEMNLQLQSKLALAFLRQSIASQAPVELLTELTRAIRRDQQQTSLHMRLAGCNLSNQEVLDLVIHSFPPNLHILGISLCRTQINDANFQTIVEGLPVTLTCLALNLSGCEGITDRGIAVLMKKLPPKLRRLDVSLHGTSVKDQSNMSFSGMLLSDQLGQLQAMKNTTQELRKHTPGSEYAQWQALFMR